MKILVTGAAGFIGSKLMHDLLERGDDVVGIDNFNDYYDVRLKEARVKAMGLDVRRMDIAEKDRVDTLFAIEKFDKVVNLAAQAGVRYSITNPYAYLYSNLVGFMNILEACRNYGVKHLVYASSSSVYGMNAKVPYNEDDKADNPVSLYAATKKSNELMAHSYCKLYGIAMTGLRYFTVYGPWGRPDMAPMLFAKAISNGDTIKVFNHGDMIRDFTYIDDIVNGTIACLDHEPTPNKDGIKYRIYNIGCSHPVKLMDFISEMEQTLGTEAKKEFLPMQPGDVYQTNADTTKIETEVGYKPSVLLHDGISRFIEWYRSDLNPLNEKKRGS